MEKLVPKGASEGFVYKTGEAARQKRAWVAIARWPDHTGKIRTKKSFHANERDAWRATEGLLDALKQLERGPVALEPQSLGVYLETWHHGRLRDGVIERTTAREEARFIRVISEHLGTRSLRKLSTFEVEEFLEKLKDAWRHEDKRPKARTIERCWRTLSKALDDVRPRLAPNPGAGVGDRPKSKKASTRVFEQHELVAILEAADQPRKGSTVPDLLFSTLIHMLVGTGVRISEALALTWLDVDLADGRIRVHHSLADEKGSGLARKAPKTAAGVREIPIRSDLVERLKALKGASGAVPIPTQPVFASESGTWLRVSNLHRRRLQPLLNELKLEQCGFHRFRHTFASIQLRQGVDIGTVSKLMGHSSLSVTFDRYGKHIPGNEHKAPKAIDEFLAGTAATKSDH